MEVTTYFEVIPEEIILNVLLKYLDNKSIYNFYLSMNIEEGNFDKFLNMMIIEEPFENQNILWNMVTELLSTTSGVMAGSYVLKNLIGETWRSDIDIYISEDYLDIVKAYIQRINDYFDSISSSVIHTARGTARYYPPGLPELTIEGVIRKKDPSIYFKLQGLDVEVPDSIYEIDYVHGRTNVNIEIVIIKSKYDVVNYMRKITDFKFLRNFVKYSSGKRKIIVDYPKKVFGKIMELNHDRKIKIDRFYKYLERGFKYFKGNHNIDIFRALDLIRGFEYPNLVGYVYYMKNMTPILSGSYPDSYKAEECIGTICSDYCLVKKSNSIFEPYFHHHHEHCISKEKFTLNKSSITNIRLVYPDILIVKLKSFTDR